MGGLAGQLGVDWKLLLSQGVNFLVVLTILTVLVYKPLLRVMRDRSRKIEMGLKGAEEAERRLTEIEAMKSDKLAEADRQTVEIIASAQDTAKNRSAEIIASAEEKADLLLRDARELIDNKKEEELEKLSDEAHYIIKAALAKTVELDPSKIDDKLIKDAAEELKRSRKI